MRIFTGLRQMGRAALGCLALVAASILAMVPTAPAVAQAEAELSITLNDLRPDPADATVCLVSFVIVNNIGTRIDDLTFQVVLFDSNGRVDSLIDLKSTKLPQSKTRVERFQLKGTPCGNISRILLNDVTNCSGGTLDSDQCLAAMKVGTSSNVRFDL